MSAVEAFLAFVSGQYASRERASSLLAGSPCVLRLHYLGGHPGIPKPTSFWVGCVNRTLRLVSPEGDRYYDLPLSRVDGLSPLSDRRILLRYEPTPGFMTIITLRGDGPAYQHLNGMIKG